MAAVVLGAGRGRRFGLAPKLLSRLGERTLIEHTLSATCAAPVRPIVVVTGRRHAAVRAAVRRVDVPSSRIRVARNRAYRTGMASSLRVGIAALPSHCDAALICLGDMPMLRPRDIQRLHHAWRPGLDYLRAGSPQRPGHPVVIGRSLFPALLALDGDRGAQRILDAVPDDRAAWFEDAGLIEDIDTPHALRNLRRRRRSR